MRKFNIHITMIILALALTVLPSFNSLAFYTPEDEYSDFAFDRSGTLEDEISMCRRVNNETENRNVALVADERGIFEDAEALTDYMYSYTEDANLAVYVYWAKTSNPISLEEKEKTKNDFVKNYFLENKDAVIVYIEYGYMVNQFEIITQGKCSETITTAEKAKIYYDVQKTFEEGNYDEAIMKIFDLSDKAMNNNTLGMAMPIQIMSALFLSILISALINLLLMMNGFKDKGQKGAVMMINSKEDVINLTNTAAIYKDTTKRRVKNN